MSETTLVSLITRRLCHDFAGPVGAVTAALDMLAEGNDPELLALVADSAASLSASLRLYRFALAPGAGPVASGTARALFCDWAKSRPDLIVDWRGDSEWPAGVAELTTGLAIVAAEAATRGGRLIVREGRVRLDAEIVRAESGLEDVLAGNALPRATDLAIAGALAAQAASLGVALRVTRDEDGLALAAYQPSGVPR